MDVPMMLTPKEFAHAAKLSEKQVRKMCREGMLAARKYGTAWRISAKELEAERR